MRRQRPVLLAVGAVACLAACSGPVAVDDADLTPELADACHALIDSLPETVADQERRDVDGHYGAAYGDPPIILRCGVDRPDQLMTICMKVEGIDWFLGESDDGAMVTTVGRTPAVQLDVPSDYAGSDAVLTDLSAAVGEHTQPGVGCS
jgi:Protein of unknown function (DUF3515)